MYSHFTCSDFKLAVIILANSAQLSGIYDLVSTQGKCAWGGNNKRVTLFLKYRGHFVRIFFMMSTWLCLLNPSALPASEGREPFLRFSVASGSMPSFIPKQHSGCVGPPAKQAPMEQKVCQCRQDWTSRGLEGRKEGSSKWDTGGFLGPAHLDLGDQALEYPIPRFSYLRSLGLLPADFVTHLMAWLFFYVYLIFYNNLGLSL